MSYDPYILIPFPEVADGCSVLLRNPQLVPPEVLEPTSVPVGPDGEPLDRDEARNAMYEVMARLIVGWKVFDASVAPTAAGEDVDPEELLKTLTQATPVRLGAITPENVGKLPLVIINKLGAAIGDAANPPT